MSFGHWVRYVFSSPVLLSRAPILSLPSIVVPLVSRSWVRERKKLACSSEGCRVQHRALTNLFLWSFGMRSFYRWLLDPKICSLGLDPEPMTGMEIPRKWQSLRACVGMKAMRWCAGCSEFGVRNRGFDYEGSRTNTTVVGYGVDRSI